MEKRFELQSSDAPPNPNDGPKTKPVPWGGPNERVRIIPTTSCLVGTLLKKRAFELNGLFLDQFLISAQFLCIDQKSPSAGRFIVQFLCESHPLTPLRNKLLFSF